MTFLPSGEVVMPFMSTPNANASRVRIERRSRPRAARSRERADDEKREDVEGDASAILLGGSETQRNRACRVTARTGQLGG